MREIVNRMKLREHKRDVFVVYIESGSDYRKFLVQSCPETHDEGTTTHYTWLDQDELDQLIINLIEARVKYGREDEL